MIRTGNPPFVERPELAFLRLKIGEAREGRTHVVVVTGEPGMGKTRLCREAMFESRQNGALRLEGSAIPGADSFLGPVAASLRDASARHDGIWRALQARARWLNGLLPELRGEVGTDSGAPDQLLAFQAILEALVDAAADSAAVWLLDDMHWADPSAWAFVRYVSRVRSSPLVLLVALRGEEMNGFQGQHSPLADLQSQAEVAHIQLQPLTPDQTAALVRASADAELPDSSVSRIVEWSAGNPAIAEEMAARGIQKATVPESVLHRLQQRARRLDVMAYRLLEVAAVAGSGTSPDLILALADGVGEHHMQQLIEGGLLSVERQGEVDSLRFRLPIFREAAYELIPWSRRRQVHLQIARHLDAVQQPEAIHQVAHHLEMAGHSQAAVQKLQGAAELAREQGHAESALTLDLAAVGLTGRRTELAAGRQPVLLGTIRNLARAGKWTALLPLAREAWHGRYRLTPSHAAEVGAVLATTLLLVMGRSEEARCLLDEATACLGPLDRLDKARDLLLAAAVAAAGDGDSDAAGRFLQASSRSAAPGSDQWAECLRLVLRFQPASERESVAADFEKLAGSVRTGHPTLAAFAFWNQARMTVRLTDAVRARVVAAGAASWVRGLGDLLLATLHLLEGRPLQSAEVLARASADLDPSAYGALWFVNVLKIHVNLHTGDLERAQALLAALESDGPVPGDLSKGLAAAAAGWLAWELSDMSRAATQLQTASRLSTRRGYGLYQLGPILLPLQVDALLTLNRETEARQVIDDFAGTHQYGDRFSRAALSAARFRLERSPEAAVKARTDAAGAGWPWLEALVLCWQGQWMGDVGGARAAEQLFDAIDARGGVIRAQSVLRSYSATRPKASSDQSHGKLSKRELTIAELVAHGLTNRQIGARLFVSPATVTTHVKHILVKLGFTSRAQIAVWLVSMRGQHYSGGLSPEESVAVSARGNKSPTWGMPPSFWTD